VSCQADAGSPLDRPETIASLALAAEYGGAAALRIQGVDNIQAVKRVSSLPIIGLTKRSAEAGGVYITPNTEDALSLVRAGSQMVAFDATDRERSTPVSQLIEAIHGEGALAMADISTAAEGQAAADYGADLISSTMAGYTPYSAQISDADWELMSELRAMGLPFAAEGRLRTPDEAARALRTGAYCVIVGSAITRPDHITRWFHQAIQGVAPTAHTTNEAHL
jgi:N-acylglucosamine-6-phosphate 2-epimerase